ncbi:hypothetical protein ZOSMA_144G00060 [Zostera marina]|uniref:Uncharacterized protein n=1 Tax=Zostera marina TaxID=29655 RepID=A0A0K9PXD5_ZOSMR|nr:hypothetical protein ZOSMA_144G00060 [Zostera marina]
MERTLKRVISQINLSTGIIPSSATSSDMMLEKVSCLVAPVDLTSSINATSGVVSEPIGPATPGHAPTGTRCKDCDGANNRFLSENNRNSQRNPQVKGDRRR